MIISHKYKFIFIKSAKTASTSIEVFLSQCCDQFDIVTPIGPHVEPHKARNYEGFYNHISGSIIRDAVGPNVWETYFKFCVERNPWEKVISNYYMKKARFDNALSFDNYLLGNDFPINFPKYTEPTDSSRLIVDKVIYYEQLCDGLEEVFRKLQIPFNGSLGVSAKSEYRTDRRPYREVYSIDQARRVAELFEPEILLHNYKF